MRSAGPSPMGSSEGSFGSRRLHPIQRFLPLRAHRRNRPSPGESIRSEHITASPGLHNARSISKKCNSISLSLNPENRGSRRTISSQQFARSDARNRRSKKPAHYPDLRAGRSEGKRVWFFRRSFEIPSERCCHHPWTGCVIQLGHSPAGRGFVKLAQGFAVS